MAIRTVDSSDHGADLVERATPPASQLPLVVAASWLMRLVLLACAGAVMQVGWVLVWMLSYHLTHGNTFTYEYLVDQSAVWEKLRDVLLLANTLGPGLEPLEGVSDFNMLVYALILGFVLAGVGYIAAILLLD